MEAKYKEVNLADLVATAMDDEHVSVRDLAKRAGISPTIIQDVKSGKRQGIALQSFLKMMGALGYTFVIKKPAHGKNKPERMAITIDQILHPTQIPEL